MSATSQRTPVTQQQCRDSWKQWEAELLLREREWERDARGSGKLSMFVVGLTPYVGLALFVWGLWCACH